MNFCCVGQQLFRLLVCALLVASALAAGASDVAFYGVLKSQQFVQTGSAAPVPLEIGGFAFNSIVLAGTDHVVTNATVKPGNSTPLRQLTTDSSQATWRFEERFHTQAALEAVYPSGNIIAPVNYTMTMGTVNNGVRTAGLSFNALLGTPPTPQVSNFAASQGVDTTKEFTLRWTANGLAIDLVQVLVLDAGSNVVAASPAPFSDGALTGQSNSFTFPPNTLPADQSLAGHITIARPGLPNTQSYPGATGVAAMVKDTEFPLVTRPALRLEVISTNAQPFRFRYTGESNRNYHVQATTDLVSWLDVFVTNSPTGTGIYTEPPPPDSLRRFYRIQVGP